MTEKKGLARAAWIYENRSAVAEELKMRGRKIAGYLCCYIPLELLAAAGYVPYRILGDMSEPITTADTYLPTVMCPCYRSCLDLGMKGKYDFLDAFMGCHACDGAERVSYVWRSYLQYPCTFYLDIPHTAHANAILFFKEQLVYLKETLEKCSGVKLSNQQINESVAQYNKQRQLVGQLYDLRKADPPPVSGTEVLHVMISLMTLPVEKGNSLLEEVIHEIGSRPARPFKKKSRVLIWGSQFDNTELTRLIEDCGLEIVMDDTAIGSRPFSHNVQPTENPLDGLAERYLDKIVCPRTFRDTGKNREDDLEKRFGYLKKFIRDWQVQGVYMNIIRNCDIHGYEVPELRYYLEEIGLPVLVIEQDYSTYALEPLRTRFQAFAESIEAGC